MIATAAHDAPGATGTRRVRTGPLAALLAGAVLATAAPATYATMWHQRHAALDAALFAKAEQGLAVLGPDPTVAVQNQKAFGPGIRPAILYSDTVMFLPQADPQPVIPGERELAVAAGTSARSVRTIRSAHQSFRVVAVPATPRPTRSDGRPTAALVLAQPTAGTDDDLRGRRNVAALVMFAGLAVCGSSLRRVRSGSV